VAPSTRVVLNLNLNALFQTFNVAFSTPSPSPLGYSQSGWLPGIWLSVSLRRRRARIVQEGIESIRTKDVHRSPCVRSLRGHQRLANENEFGGRSDRWRGASRLVPLFQMTSVGHPPRSKQARNQRLISASIIRLPADIKGTLTALFNHEVSIHNNTHTNNGRMPRMITMEQVFAQ